MARNSEIRSTPICVLPNIWRLGWVRDTKFGTMFLIKYYWMLCKNARVPTFTVFEQLKENELGSKITFQIRVKYSKAIFQQCRGLISQVFPWHEPWSQYCSQDIQIFVFPSSPLFLPVSHCFRAWSKINLKVYDIINCLNKNLQ